MLLDIRQLHGGVERVERRFGPSAFALADEEFRVTAPVGLVGEVRRDGRNARLTGRLETTLECDCSRCLEPFAVPVAATLDLLFLPATENAGEGEVAVEEDDLGVSFYQDEKIDLAEVIREQFYLALPMKPLCRPDCKGLCPTCGINRNRETCSCKVEWIDPRLEPLKALKRDDSR
jgi:uncharacterized protein